MFIEKSALREDSDGYHLFRIIGTDADDRTGNPTSVYVLVKQEVPSPSAMMVESSEMLATIVRNNHEDREFGCPLANLH